ncbi:MAG: N-acetylmuramoyl-L-alanine amidase [Acidimicrobiales bacterium]|nr:N-acetylmuramoyl-L-alanine amidase [Acidimicrobiales bacterium]
MTCSCSGAHIGRAPAPGLSRRRVLAGGLAGGLAAGLGPVLGWAGTAAAGDASGAGASAEGIDGPATRDYGFLPPRPPTEVHQQNIMFPVLPDATLGRATWTDTYLAPRSGGRRHEGQDLMGKKMLKLLACVDGTIVELRHQASGNSLYLKGTDGYYYCYLHINNDRPGTDDASNAFGNAFAPGMEIGSFVRRGEHIAYLGDSGNAEGTGAHCHFEIRLPNAKWYNAAACNAKYSLEAATPAKLAAKVAPSAFAPHDGATAFAIAQANDFLGGLPSWDWLAQAKTDLENGAIGLDDFIEKQLADPQVVGVTNPVIRLYQAYFGGIPSYAGVEYWKKQVRGGKSFDQVADEIAASSRFTSSHDVSTDREFITVFFLNLYGTLPSKASVDLRIKRMAGGMSRGQLVRYDCESTGYRTPSANRTRVISVYHAMVREAPIQKYLTSWSELDRTDPAGMRALIAAHRTGAKYGSRYAPA